MQAHRRYLLKAHRDEWDADDEHVEDIERRAQEGTLVQYQPIRHQFQEQLQCKYAREEHVELT